MPYTALPDRRMPYDVDGTVVGSGTLLGGITTYPDQTALQGLQDILTQVTAYQTAHQGTCAMWLFFPEQREVTAFWANVWNGNTGPMAANFITAVHGSVNSVNGVDGTWETASLTGGVPSYYALLGYDVWRKDIKPISFTGGKNVIRVVCAGGPTGGGTDVAWGTLHVYGEKVAGQTIHDLVFIDHDTTPGAEFTAAEDFGDRPLGTTEVRQFRLKNTSGTRTATNVNIQCNDTDFTISTSAAGPWQVTLNIASLGPGAESATMYIKNTTPAPGNLLGPRFARIVVVAENSGAGTNFFAP